MRSTQQSKPRRTRSRGAFTLIDLLVSVAVMAILAAVVVPTLTPDDMTRLLGGARMLASDIEFAQSASIATPSAPATVRFGDAGDSYWIALDSDPETPILMPGFSGDPYSITFGTGRAALLEGVTLTTAGFEGTRITFDGFARLTSLADADITLNSNKKSVTVHVSANTGAVSIN